MLLNEIASFFAPYDDRLINVSGMDVYLNHYSQGRL